MHPFKSPRFGKILKGVLSLSAVLLIGVLYFVLMKIDTGSLPIDARVTPEVLRGPYTHRNPTVLVTYANGPEVFLKNQHLLAQSALGKGFDTVHIYRQGHIDPAFYARHKDILDQPRGAGYWLWKPYFILRTMEASPEGAIITYADSSMVFAKSMAPLFELLDKTPIVFAGNNRPESVRTYLKMESRKALGIAKDDPRLDFKKIWAPFMIFKNTPQTRAFVAEWLALCEVREALTDEPFDEATQDEVFIRHLHDEALVSLVLAKHPTIATVIPKNELLAKYGVSNAHRHPHQEHTSPLFVRAGLPEWLSNALFNNPLIVFIRKRL